MLLGRNCVSFYRTNQTCRSLLEKQGQAHKWCTPMEPHIWPGKSRTTSSNIHPAAMWGYGWSPEDLPEAMNDREKWQERVRDIRASGTTWWWWWYHISAQYTIFTLEHSFRKLWETLFFSLWVRKTLFKTLVKGGKWYVNVHGKKAFDPFQIFFIRNYTWIRLHIDSIFDNTETK